MKKGERLDNAPSFWCAGGHTTLRVRVAHLVEIEGDGLIAVLGTVLICAAGFVWMAMR